jgi:hypothetical protein
MKRLSMLMVLLCVLASLAIAATRILGATIPANPDSFAAMLHRDLQLIDGVWCWRGLCPGVTTADQVTARLTAGIADKYGRDPAPTRWRPYRDSLWVVWLSYASDKVLLSIGITTYEPGVLFLPQLTTAEMIAAYGAPARVGVASAISSIIYPCYHAGLCIRTVMGGAPLLRLYSPIDTVSLTPPRLFTERFAAFPQRHAWRGFTGYFPDYNQ